MLVHVSREALKFGFGFVAVVFVYLADEQKMVDCLSALLAFSGWVSGLSESV